MAKTPTWQRKAGKNPNGGLNEAGRRSLKAAGHDIKRPQPEGGSRRDSFCARMKGMKAKLTSSETANDPDSRINKSLRAWNCADGGAIRPELGGGGSALKAALELAAKAGRNLMSHEDILKRVPELAERAKRGDFSNWQQAVDKYKPVAPWTTVPEPASYEQMLDALHANKKAHLGLGNDIPEGRRVGLRLDIPSYVDKGVWVPTVHEAGTSGKKLAHEAVARVKNATFDFPQSNALKVAQGSGKSPFAKIEGDWSPSSTQEALDIAHRYLNHPDWAQIGMDPERHAYFYDRVTQDPIRSAEDVIQVGPFVLGKNPTYGKRSDYKYADGGDVRPEMGAGGSGIKAAVNLAKNIIKTYHGSPHQFDKFDLDKLGSGVGAQAYGHGLYTSDNPNVARGYRTVIPGRVPNPYAKTPNEMTIGGKPVYSVYKDIERQAHNVPIAEASKYYDKLDVLERLMHEGDALAIKEAASNEAFSPEAYKWFQTHVEPKLNTPGGLYEINLHADPKKFIDLYSQMSLRDPLRERVASLAQHGLQNADAESAYRDAQEAMKTVRRKDIFGSDLQGALDTLLAPQGSNIRQAAGVSPDIKGPEAVARYLNREGYAGFTYPHGLDAPGPELLNRVVFDPKVMEIVKRYGQGGEVRPEMGGGGNALKAAVKMAQDIIKAYHGSPHKFDKFDISKIGTGEGAQAYGHGLYFAENPAVAQEYRDTLSSNYGPRFSYEGKDFGRGDYGKEFYKHLISSGVPQNDALAAYIAIHEGRGMQSKALDRLDQFNQDYEPTHAAREIIKKIQPTPPAGHMYEVGIKANPEHLLDWDKPLSEQPSVMERLIGGSKHPEDWVPNENVKGSRYWYDTQGGPNDRRKFMLSRGIPGIKYLDQGSRNVGEGSSNYVVFDPSLIDIMRRYADGGSVDRLHFDDGGIARIEELLRQAKGEEQATQASHPVGMSGNVEFAPVEIDEPITGSKIPLGSLPAPTAAVANPIANILAQYGPYAMGPIPAGMAAARDLATGLKEGSGLDVATAAMGAPGKMAKYGLPALGAVTDLLSPTEAQAGPYTKFLKELAEKYRPHYDPSAMIKGQPKDKWISDVALSRPIEQMSVKTTDQRNMIPEARIQPIEMAGKAMISGFGDKTPAGYVVTHLNDRKLSSPVNVLGGPAFARDQAAQIDEAYWGSNRSRASALANKGKEAVEKKYDPVFAYITQGPQSQDFSHQMTEMILGQLKKKDMDKKLVEQFDQLMREKEIKKGMPGIPTWPGLTSPKLKQWLMESREGGAGRAKMAKLMDKSMYLKAPGFADVGAARFATTHPDIMNTPIFSSGHMFSRMDPEGRLITNPKVPHPSYDTLLASPKGKQGYIGGFEYELPPELHFHDYLSGAESGYQSGIRPDLVEKPFTQKTMSLMRETPTVIGTPKWVDMASEYQDIMRYLYGRRP